MKNWKIFSLLMTCLALVLAVPYTTAQDSQVTKELQLDAFNSIGLGGSGTVNIYKGSTQKVVFKGPQKALDNLKTEVKNGSWSIEFKNGKGNRWGNNYKDVVIDITLPSVKGVSLGGSGKIIGHDSFDGEEKLHLSLAGSGEIVFSGSADDVKVSIAGSGDIKSPGLKAKKCKVSIAGSGDCELEVSESLDVSIAGSGDVKYKGSPRVNTSIAGSGKVVSMD